MIAGIIVAGGKSERMGSDVDKAFLNLGTQPMLAFSLQAYEKCPDIDEVVLVVRKDRLEAAKTLVKLYGCPKVKKVTVGGKSRQESVMNGLAELNPETTIVSVHDGARPCVTPEIISETIRTAKKHRSGVAAVKIADTIKEVDSGLSGTKTIDRTKLWAVQTPQTFKRELLEKGYAAASKKSMAVTDESSAVELVCKNVHLVPSPWSNIKITYPEDLAIAKALLRL